MYKFGKAQSTLISLKSMVDVNQILKVPLLFKKKYILIQNEISICVLGDFFNWQKAIIRTIDSSLLDMELVELCTPNAPGVTLIPEVNSFDYISEVCLKMGGHLIVIDTNELYR